MEDWIQVIYDATGIPLDEADLGLAFAEGEWALLLHGHHVVRVGAMPVAPTSMGPPIRGALATAMERRLAENLPRVREVVERIDAEGAGQVAVTVVNAEGSVDGCLAAVEGERGWPHFLLRLSAGGFDVEVDLNPYVPDDPVDWGEVRRQVEVILQVARTLGR